MDTNLALMLAGLVFAAVYLAKAKNMSRYPPGPPGSFLIGNMFDMPTSEQQVQYKKWAQEYKSDVIHLNILGTHIVILNSLEAVMDLMKKRSAIYSARPEIPMVQLMGMSWSLGLMPTNAEWRTQRRHFKQVFDAGAIQDYLPSVTHAVHDLLERFRNTPEHWNKHLHHMIGATILDIAYGIEALPDQDPFISMAEEFSDALTQASLPGAFLVNYLPMLRHVPSWVPGAGFKNKAKEWKKLADLVYSAPFDVMKQAIANGRAKPSFCTRNLNEAENRDNLAFEQPQIQGAAAAMYGAGSDTTVAWFETFMLAMVQNPEVQRKAQAELDTILGPGRLPTFADQDALPYLAALVMECWRWEAVAPFGIPHVLTVDDEYKGYLIPKGAIIIPHSYQILTDEEAYPEPTAFKPERFLKDGKIDPSVRNPMVAVFGYGRRICPGRALAEQSAWLAAGCILTMFEISKVIDATGTPIQPSGRYKSGFTR
ncbi:hypothetical protein HWV62_8106 [Athelia sp. TMB]|nr:hypothetical protein HWV62_8106 [Athelia sp. TMB]